MFKIALLLLLLPHLSAFHLPTPLSLARPSHTTLFGRAAAVRAATKGKTDARKTKIYSTFGKKIIMAVKAGGSDSPDANKALKDVIAAAKKNNVPADNIKRAIKRATEAKTGDFSESIFEAYGFGGASLIIHVLSDNANRANSDVSNAVNKGKIKMAESGSVLFLYDKMGAVKVNSVVDEELVMDVAIDCGVDDFLVEEGEGEDEGTTNVFASMEDVRPLRDGLAGKLGVEDLDIRIVYKSKAPVTCGEEDFEKNCDVIDALEDLDDVSHVEHNMDN